MSKEELKRLRYLDSRIDSKLRQLRRLKESICNVRSVDYRQDKVQTSHIASIDDLIIKMFELEESINKDIDRLIDLKESARVEINKVGGIYGVVLEMRYLENMEWFSIANRLGYSVQHIYRFHKKALKLLELTEE